jgi:hypothetical protein
MCAFLCAFLVRVSNVRVSGANCFFFFFFRYILARSSIRVFGVRQSAQLILHFYGVVGSEGSISNEELTDRRERNWAILRGKVLLLLYMESMVVCTVSTCLRVSRDLI